MIEHPTEGLVPSPEPVHLYVDLGKDPDGVVYPWHIYVKTGDRNIPVYLPAVRGVLTGVRMKILEYNRKKNYKIDFRIRSENRIWIIRSGVDTIFTRGIMLALNIVEDLTQTLVFYAKAGDTSVYGNLFTDDLQAIIPVYDTESKMLPFIQALQVNLGQEAQTLDDVEKEFNDRRR